MFIKVYDEQGRFWVLNLNHIVSVFRHPTDEVVFNMSNGDHIVCKNAPDHLERVLTQTNIIIGLPKEEEQSVFAPAPTKAKRKR